MAVEITTYAQLQTAVERWLDTDETEFTNRAEDFIHLGEVHLNRKLVLREMKQLATATYASTNTTRRISLPTGFKRMLTLEAKDASEADVYYQRVTKRPENEFANYRTTTGGIPKNYCLRDEIEFDRLVNSNHTIKMLYLKKWDIATDSTNWLLTNYPDLYLYSALVAAAPFIKDHEALATYKAMLKEGIDEANLEAHKSKDDTEMDVEQIGNGPGYNIISDT